MVQLKVGVLMGGKSVEHEVSFNSGRTVCDHLDRSLFTVIPMYQTHAGLLYLLPWHFLHRGKTSDFENRLTKEAELITWDQLKDCIDFVFIAVHGRYAEDGTLQGMLEILNIPYLGSKTFASALSMDKIFQKKILHHHGIPTALGITASATDIQNKNYDIIFAMLKQNSCPAPWIVKPSKEGSSLGVSFVHDIQSLPESLEKACLIDSHHAQDVLIESKIEGMEFSCIVLYDYVSNKFLPLPPTEIEIERDTYFYDYDQKYMPGRAVKHTPARCKDTLIEKIQNSCIRVMEILGFRTIGRIDGFLSSDGTVYIIDPNTLSGMAPASFLFREAAEIGMGHAELINHMIKTELYFYGMLDSIQIKKSESKGMQNKKRIAVLMGGNSHEKEISLESGRNVVYKLDKQKYEVIPLFVNDSMDLFKIPPALLVRNSTHEIASLVTNEMHVTWSALPEVADFVFIALHGGHGENGNVQGALEMLGIPYNGSSVLASALCMNKYACNNFLRNEGFDVPSNMLISQTEWSRDNNVVIETIKKTLSFPLIVKPHDDGCSVMVQKIKTESHLLEAIENIFMQGKTAAFIEECIRGTELTVGVIGNDIVQALTPSQVVVSGDILSIEEKFLPGAGENQTPALLPEHVLSFVKKTIENIFKVVGCKGYARIDCFYQSAEESPTGKQRVVIIEINSLPGLTPATCIFHQAAEEGMPPTQFIDIIVQLGFQAHEINRSLQMAHNKAGIEL